MQQSSCCLQAAASGNWLYVLEGCNHNGLILGQEHLLLAVQERQAAANEKAGMLEQHHSRQLQDLRAALEIERKSR